jgi:hypothetical protein
MASPIGAQLILCDAAQADPNGKIHMLGAGWSRTSSPTAPSAVAVLIKVPWDRANQEIALHLHLLSTEGKPVTVETPSGRQELSAEGNIEVGQPAGMEPGSDIDAAFVLNVPALPLTPGRYQWRLDIEDNVYTTSFQVEPRR